MSQETETTNLFKILGQNIKLQRKNKGYSQEKLAFEINTARNYIGCIERAEKSPSVATLYKISKALNAEFCDLFKGI